MVRVNLVTPPHLNARITISKPIFSDLHCTEMSYKVGPRLRELALHGQADADGRDDGSLEIKGFMNVMKTLRMRQRYMGKKQNRDPFQKPGFV